MIAVSKIAKKEGKIDVGQGFWGDVSDFDSI